MGWLETNATHMSERKEGFPERLRRLRESEREIIRVDIKSSLMGLGHDTLRKYERGEREPRLKELKAIAKHYHIGLDDFCWDEGEREDKL